MLTRPRILVRRPSPRLADGELTHLTRAPVDPDLALRQWEGYVAVFADRGWAVDEVEPADEHPDGVFIEDTVVVVDDLAVLTRPGVPSRAGEVDSTARAVAALNIAGLGMQVARIEPPGTLDGGDVLKVGAVVHVGQGSRTNAEGVRQLAALVEPRGRRVVPVPVTKVLHLKSGVTALPDGTVIGFEPLVDAPETYPRMVRARGARHCRRRPRRRRGRHVRRRPAHGRPPPCPRARRRDRARHRVREARGLRDVPVGQAAPPA